MTTRSQSHGQGRGIHQNINRTTAILSALATNPEGLRLTEVIRATHLSNASVHRILKGLAANGMVDHDRATGRYYVGIRIVSWARAAGNRFGLAERAAPALARLANRTDDTVYLTIRMGDEAVCAGRREGDYPIKTLTLSVGDRRPLGIGAGSLALIAFLPDSAECERIIAAQTADCAKFGIDEPALREMIETARGLGYALNEGRIIPGMSALAVPVFGSDGVPLAALSAAALMSRMESPRREEIVAELRAEAERLQEHLYPRPAGAVQTGVGR
ncbi:MAG TPA: IclR family transcriptional regulator [bacterium]|nr:IclR family transcriptional regulator [bacterium]